MRRFFNRSGILFALTFVHHIFASGCSENRDSLSTAPALKSQTRRYHFDPRPNPLQEYIQDNWTNGSTVATGGSNYPNIKIYGHTYKNLSGYPADAGFIARHFDMVMWGGPIVGDSSAASNPTMVWLHEAGNIPSIRSGYDSTRVELWIDDSANNPMGYDWSDLLLYYKYDTTNWVGTFPGWNPGDDTDGSECIDSTEGNNGLPSVPNRTAQCEWDARALLQVGSKHWMLANVPAAAYADFTADEAKYAVDTWNVEGFHFDVAAYQSLSLNLGNTFTYEGWSETDPDFPYIEDKIAFLPSVMADVESEVGSPVIAIANMVSPTYICNSGGYYEPQHDYALAYLENLNLEAWLPYLSYANTSRRERLLECPFLDFLEQGKGIAFTYREVSPTEQGKLFSLAMFYMINHQMAFYFYMLNNADGTNAENTFWNPWVEYDVGQPVVNNLGFNDFQNQSGTNRFFVFASGSTYEVLGRQFLRSDNKRVLVLAKVMGPNESLGAGTGTTIALNGSYKKVLSDFTLGPTINQITLVNNEGVILVKQTGSGCKDCDPEG